MTAPGFLPPDLAEYARDSLDRLTGPERWEVERFAEMCFARGYAMGHERGYTGAWVQRDRDAQRRGPVPPAPAPPPLPPAYDPTQAGHHEGSRL